MTFPNVADISDAQQFFDPALYRGAGRRAVIIKATESVYFTSGDYASRRDAAHAQSLVTGEYHYAGSSYHGALGAPEAEGDHFLSATGHWTPNRFAVCDFENPLPGHGPPLYGLTPAEAAQWTWEFLNYIAKTAGWPGMGYSMAGDGVIQQLQVPFLKWYAAYPGPVPGDRALHQYTDSAQVAGVGRCDDSHCYVDLVAFANPEKSWTFQEEPMSYPKPVPNDGIAHSIPVTPPHSGACQGGYGNVWLSFSWDNLDTPIDALLKARIIAIKFDGSLTPLNPTDTKIDWSTLVPKTRWWTLLPDNTASVTAVILSVPDGIKEPDRIEMVPMVEAEVKGVPAT